MDSSKCETVYLKTLDGFNFEQLCSRIIERLGWGKVTVTPKARDGGKDLIITTSKSEVIFVECKHQPSSKIGTPVLQKLHSALITSNASKGIIITTGSFSKDAIEFAKDFKPPIELIDLLTLTEMAQNVRIKLISEDHIVDCFYISFNSDSLLEKVQYYWLKNVQSYPRKIEELINFETLERGFLPIYKITYSIHDSFSTQVGELDSIDEDNGSLILNGSTRKVAENTLLNFIRNNSSNINLISDLKESTRTVETIDKIADLVSLNKLAKQIIIDGYTTEISYVGANNVKYQKKFNPKQSSITLKDIQIIDIRYRKIKINQGPNSKELITLDSENDVILDHDFPFCDYCGGKENLMVCDSCFSIFDFGFRKHGQKCSKCHKTICVNCLYKYKWPSFLRGYISEECSLELYGKELSGKRRRKKVLKPNYWDFVKDHYIFKI